MGKLREKTEAENKAVKIPMAARWLGRLTDIRERAERGEIGASSVTFVVKGEKTANSMIKNGISRILRCHY